MIKSEPLEGIRYADIKRALPLLGAGMLLLAVWRRSWASLPLALLGGGLVYRAVRERMNGDERWKLAERGTPNLLSIPRGQGIRVEKVVVIQRPADELYRFWRKLENLPVVMSHLERVIVIDAIHSHWVARAPAGMQVEWDAEIINDIENELIGWRSVQGADVSNAGSVHFVPAPSANATILRVNLKYDPPAGQLGAVVARLFGTNPDQTVEQDLRRFKQWMETGAVPPEESWAEPVETI